MDEASLHQLESLWPDVAAPFSRVVPDGLTLVHVVDDWSAGPRPLRRRQIDLFPAAGSPPLAELLEEATEDAERRGWTRLDDADDDAAERVFELEDVHLTLAIRTVPVFGEPWPVLRARFDQPWPDDAGAPVETSEIFQNLVRNLLRLGAHPEKLTKELTLDPFDQRRIDVVLETVELAKDRDLMRELVKLSFRPEPDASVKTAPGEEPALVFVSRSVAGNYDVTARVREVGGGARYEVEMSKKRLVS